jgi:hypothetical protein
MDKNTKMLLGVGVLAVAGYLVYKQMNQPKNMANASGRMSKYAYPKGTYHCYKIGTRTLVNGSNADPCRGNGMSSVELR